jgi:hypothetical protein
MDDKTAALVVNVASMSTIVVGGFAGGAKMLGKAADLYEAGELGSTVMNSIRQIPKLPATVVRSAMDKASDVKTMAVGKMSNVLDRASEFHANAVDNLRNLVSGGNVRVAFAGDSTSVMNRVSFTADSSSAVRASFSESGDIPYNHERVMLKNGDLAFKSADGNTIRKASYMDDAGDINWPTANGFETDNAGNALTKSADLKEGQVIDRYGNSKGKFTSPVEDGQPAAYDTRGLPYPEETQAYHQYKVTQDINSKSVREAYDKLSPNMKSKLADEMARYDFTLDDISNPQQGKIADVFDSGGGTQVKLGTTVEWYERLGLLEEVK